MMSDPVRVTVSAVVDPATLWNAAFKAYTHGDEARRDDAKRWLGTIAAPLLGPCMAEVVAENDRESLFDDLQWDEFKQG